MVDLGVYLWYYISIETRKQINKKMGERKMRKSYKGLCKALKTAENIIIQNLGLEWDDFVDIFKDDQIIYPYYFEVCEILLAGRNTLRYENE